MKDYSYLQNGSDIRGIAITGVPGQLPNLRPQEGTDIAKGFLVWLCRKLGKRPQDLTIAMGRDPRISAKKLIDGLMHGFGPYGARILDCGLASTPAMFMATVFPDLHCDASLMITARHLPFNRNGFKFFTPEGGLNKEDIRDILAFAGDEAVWEETLGEPVNADGAVHRSGEIVFLPEEADVMGPYCAHLRDLIIKGCDMGEKPLSGMKIVVDAGNGSGGFYARKVLRPLGADISASMFLDPDGMFMNHAPNPEDRDVMQDAALKVLASGADLGLVFDTDVDRSAAVDGRGHEIARNGIVAMAAALVAEEHPGTTVVTDSITSNQLTDFLENELGLRHFRFRRGYRNVIKKAIELNAEGTDCQLAIETSGHAAMKENYFLDDGAYLATKIVIRAARLRAEGKKLEDILANLKEPAEEKEIRIPVLAKDFASLTDRVLEDLKVYAEETEGMELEEPNYEGVRIRFADGWCLLRKSLHDPIMPMNIASDRPGGCGEILEVMEKFLSAYDGLDRSVLR